MPASSTAQAVVTTPLNVALDHEIDRWRLATLRDTAAGGGFLLRSTSVIQGRSREGPWQLIAPRFALVDNSAIPFGGNDGWLWAGRGTNMSLGFGLAAETRFLRVILAPELVYSRNDSIGRDSVLFPPPQSWPGRSPFVHPWYASGPYSADYPIRFGENPMRRLTPGQSSITFKVPWVEFGFATENHWWGPGLRNALVLSNNAPGFPHLFLRSAEPWRTIFGDVEFRWIVGGLTESRYFDTDDSNDLRSLAAGAITLEPWWAPTLTLGATRAVMGTATGWGQIPLRWLDLFRIVPRTNDVAFGDSLLRPGGREQVFSLFARLRLPPAGVETYVEWGRTESPHSLRDLLVAPNHTQAYTVGLQWRSSPRERFWRTQFEHTTTEQGPTFRERPLGVWYTSRRVIQGYTNRGQVLGAAVGPGSSGQWLAIDRFTRGTQFGVYAGRIRHNDDVRNLYDWPDWQSYCTHDVNVFGGARAAAYTPFGHVALDAAWGNRLNLWFQFNFGCPRGFPRVDVSNTTLAITWRPLASRPRAPQRNGRR